MEYVAVLEFFFFNLQHLNSRLYLRKISFVLLKLIKYLFNVIIFFNLILIYCLYKSFLHNYPIIYKHIIKLI